jgi:hypothetical protein
MHKIFSNLKGFFEYYFFGFGDDVCCHCDDGNGRSDYIEKEEDNTTINYWYDGDGLGNSDEGYDDGDGGSFQSEFYLEEDYA